VLPLHAHALTRLVGRDSDVDGGSDRLRSSHASKVPNYRIGNLRPLCRRHHRLKTHAGWTITTDPLTGQIGTRSPTGLTYLRPQPTLVITGDALASDGWDVSPTAAGDGGSDPVPQPSRYDGPPPF
jgi:hypothetical protein